MFSLQFVSSTPLYLENVKEICLPNAHTTFAALELAIYDVDCGDDGDDDDDQGSNEKPDKMYLWMMKICYFKRFNFFLSIHQLQSHERE